MRVEHVLGLAVGGLVLGGGLYAALRGRGASIVPERGPAQGSGSAGGGPPGEDPIVAPAYPYLDLWSSDARRALYELQRELGLDPRAGGLAGVIGHESGGRPDVPKIKSGTPRGGLIQVTIGARLPGYETADAVWNIRNQGIVDQLNGVVRDYYKRQMPHGPPRDQGAAALLRRNYLPGLADKSASFVLGVRTNSTGPGGEKSTDSLAGSLTRGANYAANPGFDPHGRGWFTWEDVDRQAIQAERAAVARGWTRVSGARAYPSASGSLIA